MRDKKYYNYRGKLMDFKDLFQNGINDVTFEVIFKKLMNSFLDYRIVDLANTYRLFHKAWEPHLDDNGDIKKKYSTEDYAEKSLNQHSPIVFNLF